jgi:hypothetical protein
VNGVDRNGGWFGDPPTDGNCGNGEIWNDGVNSWTMSNGAWMNDNWASGGLNFLNDVVVTGATSSTSYFDNALKQLVVFGISMIGTTVTNNMTFGLAQTKHAFIGTELEGAERIGRLSGDIITMFQGIGEDIFAGGAEVVTLGGATVPAVGIAIHGTALTTGSTYAGAQELKGLVDYFSKKGHGSGSGKPKMGNNGSKNEEVISLVKKYRLDKINQRKLHDYITGQNYSRAEIEEIIKNGEYLMK